MNMYLLFFIALIPIVWLMVSLGVVKTPGHKATPVTLMITFVLAVLVWKMPVMDAVKAGLEGVASALWPIFL
jgi:lactate permease